MSCDGRGDRDSEPAQVGRRTLRCGVHGARMFVRVGADENG